MALKPNYNVTSYEVGFFLNETAERGLMLCSATGTPGSGAAMDSFNQLATVAVNPSGRYPLGMLWEDFVNQDLTEQPLNRFKYVAQMGNKATIITQGTMLTDRVVGASTVIPGQPAYLAGTGLISATQANGAPQIGRFLSRPDADGYAKISVNCVK